MKHPESGCCSFCGLPGRMTEYVGGQRFQVCDESACLRRLSEEEEYYETGERERAERDAYEDEYRRYR